MHIKRFSNYFSGIVYVIFLAFVFLGCDNRKNNGFVETKIPEFDAKFPQKSIWICHSPNDSIEFTFSSMEEAEWKLLHATQHSDFLDVFEKIILSDSSFFEYPFDSLFQNETLCELYPPVKSDDGNVLCFGIYPHSAYEMPMMVAFYKLNGMVYKAEESERAEDCYYCMRPDTIYTFRTDNSMIYLIWGYNGYTGSGESYRLCAYELDNTGLHPAFVFEEGGVFCGREEDGQSLYVEICTSDELYEELEKTGFRTLGYFDSNKSTVYTRAYIHKEIEEYGCSTRMTNHYRKFVWNGKKFVCGE